MTAHQQLASLLRELAPYLIKDDAKALIALIGFTGKEEDLRRAAGLCFMARKLVHLRNYDKASVCGLLYHTFSTLYGSFEDPFKELGASYYATPLNFPIRGQEALRIAEHLEQQ